MGGSDFGGKTPNGVSHIAQDELQEERVMSVTRRNAIKTMVATVAALATPSPAAAVGFIEGPFYVRCPNPKCKHDDKVEALTRNHNCSKCWTKSVNDGTAIVVCPVGHGGEENKVEGITRQHQCQHKLPGGGICGKQCRR
jgi:hypothetical protein